ncbi:MAG: glycosyltransferase [Miltoncostaeaceae bacterium]
MVIGALALGCWAGVLLHPARPWDLRPMADDDPPPPNRPAWPAVGVVIPARNEADGIAATLAGLDAQDYPGEMNVVVVDERSSDATGEVARRAASGMARPCEVITGEPLPDGWAGKVWGMDQGVRRHDATGNPEWLLLTDADIRHAPDSVRRLVGDAQDRGVALDSRMARLRCESFAERLLIPPFVLFFFLLYPLRWANRVGSRTASAAGGCILVTAEALSEAGGLQSIRGALIDDLSLVRRVKYEAGHPTRLALSRTRVVSTRPYDGVGDVWTMVRRSAFTQLRRNWLLLAGVLAVLLLMFAGPLVAIVAGAVGAATGAGALAWWALGLGISAWLAMAIAEGPTAQEFGLGVGWQLALPISGLLYGAMTLDSALRGPRGGGWR